MISKESKIWIEIIEIAKKLIQIRTRLKNYQLRLIQKTAIRKQLFMNNLNRGMERNRCHIAENVETPIPDIRRKFRTLTSRREWNMESSGTIITEIHTV
jgi:hypothetical protein